MKVELRKVGLESLLPLWHLVTVVRVIIINTEVNELLLHLVYYPLTCRLKLLLERVHIGSCLLVTHGGRLVYIIRRWVL